MGSLCSLITNYGMALLDIIYSYYNCNNKHCWTCFTRQQLIALSLSGNTVHYRVKLEPAIETPSCTLTVTGTQMGRSVYVCSYSTAQPFHTNCRFTAGLMFLQQLVIEAEEEKEGKMLSCVPFTQIWLNLIVSACQLTGQERLKIVHLLLRLLAMMKDRCVQLLTTFLLHFVTITI